MDGEDEIAQLKGIEAVYSSASGKICNPEQAMKREKASMTTESSLLELAGEHARALLSLLGERWLHIKGVVEDAQAVGKAFNEEDRVLLIAAAYMHDIGHAPSLNRTDFHPLDGAYYLLSHNQQRLASLVAYHSEAQYEAHLRGLTTALEKIPQEHSAQADAL